MKQVIISLGLLFVLLVSDASAQYTYLHGQPSPFNGEFNEPRLVEVDSFSYIRYVRADYDGFSFLDEDFVESIDGFRAISAMFLTITTNDNGDTDFIKGVDVVAGYEPPASIEHTKKYDENDRLISYSGDLKYTYMNSRYEYDYEYDEEGRIQQIALTSYQDGNATVITYDTTKYDYTFKPLWTSETVFVNTIYENNDSTFIYYTDNGYEIIYNAYGDGHYETVTFNFDDNGRMSEYIINRVIPMPTSSNPSTYVDYPTPMNPSKMEYKYTDSGYKAYINGALYEEYKFQDDGYLVEYLQYMTPQHISDPKYSELVSIDKYSYFKDGEVIVSNDNVAEKAPSVVGMQGAAVVNAGKAVDVSVYTFAGSMVKQVRTSVGETSIPLSKGLYIITIGSISYKILIH
jgi:hypothetical protein